MHIKGFITWYANRLQTYPLSTKAITSGLIAGGGDLTCQYLIYRRRKEGQYNSINRDRKNDLSKSPSSFHPDLTRTCRFSILGFGLIAPVVHVWYGLLMKKIPGTSLGVVLQRTFLDQVCFAPLFIPTFMTSLMILESKPLDSILPVLIKDLPDVVVTNWILWIPAMIINFRYIPGQWQVLYSNCVGFVWNTYLSWKTQESPK
mmetsp:Transcript_10487/g.13298  ORF Transcript_10487/g.13298 Transcript_10487/m.13298 type:complete len:203 (+) Transcript_10487:99-707(+)